MNQQELYMGVDVGGTNIRAACVSAQGEMIGGSLEVDSPSGKNAEQTIDALAALINSAKNLGNGYQIAACGIGIPAPFDYHGGVSLMRHKFTSLYGVDILHPLQEKTGLSIKFLNDADAFGIGCAWRLAPGSDRLVALTIGTGLGSSFIENGRSLDDDPRVPPGGEIWDLPYESGKLEDAVSARAVSQAYESHTGKALSAKEVASLALAQDAAAVNAFISIGRALGKGLAPICDAFKPQTIIIGGKVSGSFDLFCAPLKEELGGYGSMVMKAPPENLAIFGAAHYVMANRAI